VQLRIEIHSGNRVIIAVQVPEVQMDSIDRDNNRRNLVSVGFILDFMDLAVANCRSASLSVRGRAVEDNILRAKQAYRDALVLAGRLSFSAKDVAEFEWRSVQLERMIARLQAQRSETAQLAQTKAVK
jgi:hypothetical protein